MFNLIFCLLIYWQVDGQNFGVLEFSLEDKRTQYKVTKISYSLSRPDYIIPILSYPFSLSLLHLHIPWVQFSSHWLSVTQHNS